MTNSEQIIEAEPDYVAAQRDREKIAEKLLDAIFDGREISDDAAQALLFILELALDDGDERDAVNIAHSIRERLFYRSTFGDRLIREFTDRWWSDTSARPPESA